MKKLFLVLVVASLGFVACNNESETKTETDTTQTNEQPTIAPPTQQDTTVRGNDSVGAVNADTSVKK